MRDDTSIWQVVIGALGLVVACIAIVVGLLSPEIRYFLGLEQRQKASIDEPAIVLPTTMPQPSATSIPQPTATSPVLLPTATRAVPTLTIAPPTRLPPTLTPLPTQPSLPVSTRNRESTGSETKTYTVTLADGEIIVGQGYKFIYGSGNVTQCYVFLIRGPGQFTFSLFDGAWSQYQNVISQEQAENLLQQEIETLSQYKCKPINTVRIP
jgi:hypothetical protein